MTYTIMTDEQIVSEINVLLAKIGQLASVIDGRGENSIAMWLWDWNRPGSTIKGSLQGNTAAAYLEKR